MSPKCMPLLLIALFAFASCGGLTSSDDAPDPLIEMVPAAGGTFKMGTPGTDGHDNERPVHNVTISSFYMGKYEITQAQYQAVMGTNPSWFIGNFNLPAEGDTPDNRPVEQVSWYDALVFCNKLSMSKNVTPVYSFGGRTDPAEWGNVPAGSNEMWDAVECNWDADGYRLPTEAEWEYAAKGGNGLPNNYTYSGSNDINEVAWHEGNSGKKTHEAGKKTANGLGLYDMSGNVWEWCWDRNGTYPSTAQTDPTGAPSGVVRVIRGGSWRRTPDAARSAARAATEPNGRSDHIGFRVVRG